MEKSTYTVVLEETNQTHDTRRVLYEKLEGILKRPILAFFTSFQHPVSIDNTDADRLQDVIQRMETKNGLALLISSPGGNGISSERIINICRTYSDTNEYWAVVPGRAKSAATIICMGASKIWMSPTSELGPIDPQIFRKEDGEYRQWSAFNLITSYDTLFDKARRTKGNIEPFMQQLAHYDERDIETWRSMIKLSDDIATKALSTGMLKGKTLAGIRKNISVFLNPSAGTQTHGRQILSEEARQAGLVIEDIDVKTELWRIIAQIYTRLDNFVIRHASKAIETKDEEFILPI